MTDGSETGSGAAERPWFQRFEPPVETRTLAIVALITVLLAVALTILFPDAAAEAIPNAGHWEVPTDAA